MGDFAGNRVENFCAQSLGKQLITSIFSLSASVSVEVIFSLRYVPSSILNRVLFGFPTRKHPSAVLRKQLLGCFGWSTRTVPGLMFSMTAVMMS